MRRALALGGAALAVLGSPVASAHAVTPNSGQLLDSGTAVGADCTLEDKRVDGHSTSWEISNVIPAFKHGGKKGGVELAPPAEQLPRIGKQPHTDVFGANWVMTPRALATPVAGQGCMLNSIDIPPVVTFAPFGIVNVTLDVAGPHLMTRYDSTVHYVGVGGSSDDPTPAPCSGNDPDFSQPADIAAPDNPPSADGHWAVSTFCNITINTGFNVKAASSCPISGDMSQWTGSPYISQYDAGKRLVLPIGQSRAGGNACGPSSLLMAMLRSASNPVPSNLPTLQETFDATMRLPSTLVRPNGENVFVGNPKGVTYLKSLGWKQARSRETSTAVEIMEERILTSLQKGPIVISTAFGGARWGMTGGGHMIAIMGADAKGNWIVDDPAGNFFSTPKAGYSDTAGGHYGPGSCGHLALYPHFWLLAYVTGRWFLELGPRSAPSTTAPRRSAARAAELGHGLGKAFSVYDANPGAADAPASFWVQDASGRKAGWIDGQPVEEIPDSSVAQDVAGFTNPAIGDDTGSPDPGEPPAAPRGVVVVPAAGMTVHVAGGSAFALRTEAWEDGRLVGGDLLKGTGNATPASAALTQLIASPQLSTSKARVKKRGVSVKLRCTASAKSACAFSAVLTAKQGKRTVTVAKAGGSLASGKGTVARLKPTAAGRRLLAKKRRIAATLVVTQVRTGGTPVVVRTQKLRI